MCQVSVHVTYDFKNELIFMYIETETEKKETKKMLTAENKKVDNLHVLTFTSAKIIK